MGIFDGGDTNLIEETDPQNVVRRVSDDLLATIKRDNIALEIADGKIKLLSQSRTTLEITCDATNAFRLVDGGGNYPDRFLTKAARAAPKKIVERRGSAGPPASRSGTVPGSIGSQDGPRAFRRADLENAPTRGRRCGHVPAAGCAPRGDTREPFPGKR